MYNSASYPTPLADLHTHSVYSLHAMSSPSELIAEAEHKGLEFLAITDHIYPYEDKWQKLNQIDRVSSITEYCNSKRSTVRVIGGGELNLFCQEQFDCYDMQNGLNILGFHSWFIPQYVKDYDIGMTLSHIGQEYSNMLSGYKLDRNFRYMPIHIIAHPTRDLHKYVFKFAETCDISPKRVIEIFFESLVAEASKNNVMLEINAKDIKDMDGHELKTELMETYIKIALADPSITFSIGTDAHISSKVGNMYRVIAFLQKYNIPYERVINFDRDMLNELFDKITKKE